MQQTLHEKTEVIKSFEAEMEKVQCGLMCEREQTTTLSIEHTTTKAKLVTVQNQSKRIQEDLDHLRRDSQAKV